MTSRWPWLSRLPGGRRPPLPVSVNNARFEVTPERVTTLSEMLENSTGYTQRCLERVSFLPAGGQRWERNLQIQIPESAIPSDRTWRIVSLGVFRRRRFPDLVVSDASGARVNLLTRRQHGTALSLSFMSKHFRDILAVPNDQGANPTELPSGAKALQGALYGAFTTIDADAVRTREATLEVVRIFRALLRPATPLSPARTELVAFVNGLVAALSVTQYLCWVQAEAGEVINLRVTWTSEDVQHELAPLGGIAKAMESLWYGLVEPRSRRREVHSRWYGQYGLAPLNYGFKIPSHDHAGSYYLTLEPPARTDVTYLDWETGNSLQSDKGELDSAFCAMHLHHEDAVDSATRGRVIRAYVRCAPHEHKKVAAGAFLNAVFVFLVAFGRLKTDASAQTWLLVTPTVLTAYLAQQQRHYYAHTTRRQRGILWAYLAISVTFLVTLAFSHAGSTTGSRGWGWFAITVAAVLAISSVAVAVWYAPLGYSFQRITEWKMRRGLANNGGGSSPKRSTRLIYEEAVHSYCDWIVRVVGLAMVATAAAILLTWHFSPVHKARRHRGRGSGQVASMILTAPVGRSREAPLRLRGVIGSGDGYGLEQS
jgi:hypothetical protein